MSRRDRIGGIGVCVLLLALVVTEVACELPDPPEQQPDDQHVDEPFELDGAPQAGVDPYDAQCAECHGNTGEGDGPLADTLTPRPTDFTAVELDEQHVYEVTRHGGEAAGLSPVMPAFDGVLDDDEIRNVTAYVMELSEGAGDAAAGAERQ